MAAGRRAILFAWFVRSNGADWLSDLIAIFAFFTALGYGLRLGLQQRRAAERPTSFGSAKWATEAYLLSKGLFAGKGFLLGEFVEDGKRRLIHYAGARHLLTVAPTRSGKGVASIVPNLLTYEGSAIVIDPKGENAMITAVRRGQGDAKRGIPGLGQAVHLLDPWNLASSKLGVKAARFNPLDWIKADDPDAAENAFLLAEALVTGDSSGEGKFWDSESKALLTGLILYVATSKREVKNRHLGRVRDILIGDEATFKTTLEDMYNEPNALVASTAARTSSKDPKLRSNVLASAQAHTHFLDSPRIRESLSASDFRFEDLKTTPMSVFLILPADRLQTFDRWMRLLIQQAITVNARNIDVKPEKPVLFLLDEMAALGHLSMVEQAYGLMAGFGMQLWGIVQDLSQLERIYNKGWQTFISNSGVIQYFGSRDKHTAEYFSTLCGVTTIRINSFSYALGRVFGTSSGASGSSTGSSQSTSHTNTINWNESQRQLAYPDELMVLKEDDELIFVENYDPIGGVKVRWYSDPNLSRLGINLQPEAQKQIEVARQPVVEPPPLPVYQKPAETPQPKVETPAPQPHVVNRYEKDGTAFAIYSDGSIVMSTTEGTQTFASMAELKSYMAVKSSLSTTAP